MSKLETEISNLQDAQHLAQRELEDLRNAVFEDNVPPEEEDEESSDSESDEEPEEAGSPLDQSEPVDPFAAEQPRGRLPPPNLRASPTSMPTSILGRMPGDPAPNPGISRVPAPARPGRVYQGGISMPGMGSGRGFALPGMGQRK
eukprot:GABV01010724.1.p3 GENE.GABV01010724.1~~GABV01010724.1.p3  ORF type:complete len:152 (-),score=46.51 GABV01010724.1:24-458(-)